MHVEPQFDGSFGRLRPPRLGDPLAVTRNLLFVYTLILVVTTIVGPEFYLVFPADVYFAFWTFRLIANKFVMLIFTSTFILLTWPILLVVPYRHTNAFYFRAFRGDRDTGPLRLAIKK